MSGLRMMRRDTTSRRRWDNSLALIHAEIPLREHAEPHQLLVVLPQKPEIAGELRCHAYSCFVPAQACRIVAGRVKKPDAGFPARRGPI
jgi:hypothetical protein